jgi:hypothetical protein
MSAMLKLHTAEIAALKLCTNLTPDLIYDRIHWTGQYLILMEFISGVQPSASEGITSITQIDQFIVELAEFHKSSLHFGMWTWQLAVLYLKW